MASSQQHRPPLTFSTKMQFLPAPWNTPFDWILRCRRCEVWISECDDKIVELHTYGGCEDIYGNFHYFGKHVFIIVELLSGYSSSSPSDYLARRYLPLWDVLHVCHLPSPMAFREEWNVRMEWEIERMKFFEPDEAVRCAIDIQFYWRLIFSGEIWVENLNVVKTCGNDSTIVTLDCTCQRSPLIPVRSFTSITLKRTEPEPDAARAATTSTPTAKWNQRQQPTTASPLSEKFRKKAV